MIGVELSLIGRAHRYISKFTLCFAGIFGRFHFSFSTAVELRLLVVRVFWAIFALRFDTRLLCAFSWCIWIRFLARCLENIGDAKRSESSFVHGHSRAVGAVEQPSYLWVVLCCVVEPFVVFKYRTWDVSSTRQMLSAFYVQIVLWVENP